VGRPSILLSLRELVLRIARDTGWGYTRVLGELRKLTSRRISRQTVVNILREHGLDPGPKRGEKTWSEFVGIHAQTLWQSDLFIKKIWTPSGVRDCFLLVFLHVASWRVLVRPGTMHPNAQWVATQAEAFCEHVRSEGERVDFVFHDCNTKFTRAFDEVLRGMGRTVRRLTRMTPNLNAFVERWIQSIQHECLDHFIVFGEAHLNHLVEQYVEQYHTERPHQGIDIGNVPLVRSTPTDDSVPLSSEIVCRERLDGLLKSYSRCAA
jgi:putative transposase